MEHRDIQQAHLSFWPRNAAVGGSENDVLAQVFRNRVAGNVLRRTPPPFSSPPPPSSWVAPPGRIPLSKRSASAIIFPTSHNFPPEVRLPHPARWPPCCDDLFRSQYEERLRGTNRFESCALLKHTDMQYDWCFDHIDTSKLKQNEICLGVKSKIDKRERCYCMLRFDFCSIPENRAVQWTEKFDSILCLYVLYSTYSIVFQVQQPSGEYTDHPTKIIPIPKPSLYSWKRPSSGQAYSGPKC